MKRACSRIPGASERATLGVANIRRLEPPCRVPERDSVPRSCAPFSSRKVGKGHNKLELPAPTRKDGGVDGAEYAKVNAALLPVCAYSVSAARCTPIDAASTLRGVA